MKLPLARVAEFLTASGEFDPKAIAQGYSIDSRTIQTGELFFSVKGERMDGHDFVPQALHIRKPRASRSLCMSPLRSAWRCGSRSA